MTVLDSIAETIETLTLKPSSTDLLLVHNNNNMEVFQHKLQTTGNMDPITTSSNSINSTKAATATVLGTKPSYLHSLFNTTDETPDTLE